MIAYPRSLDDVETRKGFHLSFVYLHNEAERLNGYDLTAGSFRLYAIIQTFLRQTALDMSMISIEVEIDGTCFPAILYLWFTSKHSTTTITFDKKSVRWGVGRNYTGYIVLAGDKEGREDAINRMFDAMRRMQESICVDGSCFL